jgi:predicted DCC family thiol-disulfide oxidoreductase YuxK
LRIRPVNTRSQAEGLIPALYGMPMPAQPETRPTVVFDTDCVLCSGMVQFVLAHERGPDLYFVGAWSAPGLALAERHGFTQADLNDTFLVIRDGRALTRSDAGLALARRLRRPWCWLAGLGLVPRPIRDGVYDLVARHRYRWFGRRPSCVVVEPRHRHRFLDVDARPGAERG